MSQKEYQTKEYQTIVLAGLLHDIGKFLQRAEGKEGKGKHEQYSADYIAGKPFREIVAGIVEAGHIDLELLKIAVLKHHIKDQPLVRMIVSMADSFSSNERREANVGTEFPKLDREYTAPKITPLYSIFTKLMLDANQSPQASVWTYPAIPLSSTQCFPREEAVTLDDNEIRNLAEAFQKEFMIEAGGERDFTKFYNTVYALLEKYTWCIPSDTTANIPDVSLFDHLKSSSAIAASLYKYLWDEEKLESVKANKELLKNQNETRFLLVGGNLSGIQSYIYQVSTISGYGGVAKRLRARSFYISALMEVTVQKILRELDLPISCSLFNSAGKFILLVPNTSQTRDRLKALNTEISEWFLKEFSGELYLNMVWDIEMAGEDFHIARSDTAEEIESNFRDKLYALETSIKRKKTRRFDDVLIGNQGWQEESFVLTEKYEQYNRDMDESGKAIGDCKSCRKFPATQTDPDEPQQGEKVFCEKCLQDLQFGRNLLKAEYLALGKKQGGRGQNSEDTCFMYEDGYFYRLLQEYKWEPDFIMVEKIRDRRDEVLPVKTGCIFRFLAAHVPYFEDEESRRILCDQVCKKSGEPCGYSNDTGKMLTFNCIAARSSKPYSEQEPDIYAGEQLLGYLKADVDNMGQLFHRGLGKRLTISRYLTISRMMNLFFSGWIHKIMEPGECGALDLSSIYTVYSGGDDLVLVGPWEDVILFAGYLYKEFKRFTCNNPNINISAGIAVVHPRFPVARAVAEAGKHLEEAKQCKGKNKIKFFNTLMEWEDIEQIKDLCDFFNERIREKDSDKKLNRTFLFRLLEYQSMFQDYKLNRNIESLSYRSMMAYDIARNVLKKLDEEEKNKVLERLQPLFDDKVDGGKIFHEKQMYNLKPCLSWCILKNRREIHIE